MRENHDLTLDRYQLISLLGRGGMAEVFKAYQPGLDRYVAVKLLHPHLAYEPGFISRFEREAASVARLRHPNIVQVIDFDCQDGRYYMVMEFIEGASLRDELERRAEMREPYTAREAANVISDLVSALDYAHGRGMLHRDVKPGNILFTGEGQVVLADFGIAHIVGTTLYTESGSILGTPAYMAPEQGRGELGDARGDIYSLGVVLYQMLLGRLPFEADTPLGLIQQHIEAPLPAPRSINPYLPQAIEAVILKALAKDPAERYQRAGEMALALLEAIGMEPDQVVGIAALPRILETPERLEISRRPLPACPYRGLFAFHEEDAPYFFGREDFTDQLIAAVEERPLVAVVGPSGSGKSSVVLAGLLPHMRQAAGLRGAQGRAWLIADLRPGANPFYSLSTALLPFLETDLSKTDQLVETRKLARVLETGEVLLQDVVDQILQASPEHGRLLLVIDQFEELYTLCTQPDLQRRFVETLLKGLEGDSSLNLVLALRADFLGQAFSHRQFADALQDADLILGPMTQGELAQAIESPARKQGASFEAGLVERILDDVGEEPGNLALLEFALTQLWEEQKTGQLTHAAYEAIDRVEGALARYADQVYADIEPAQQEAVRHVFTQMVRPGEGALDTRRLALREELGEANWELVQRLADARLVVTGREAAAGQETAEVVHEALIQGWEQLRVWMRQDRAFRTWQERLRGALHQWEASKRDEGALLRGVPLAEAQGWLEERPDELSEAEKGFIRASVDLRQRQQVERERRRRATVLALVGGLIVALVLAFWANSQRLRAETAEQDALSQASIADSQRLRAEAAEQDALRQASIGLALRAESEIAGLYPERGVLLALEVLEYYPYTWQAERALGNAVLESRLRLILRHEDEINLALWSPDGSRILTANDDDTARIWDARTGEALHILSGHSDDVTLAAWSPDGALAVTAGPDGSARLWEGATGQELFTLIPVEAGSSAGPVPITALAFNPDGSALATGSEDGTVKIWGITEMNGAIVLEARHTLSGHWTRINHIAWSPDGSRVITACFWEPHKVWDAFTGSLQYEITVGRGLWENSPISVWSPDGGRVITAFWLKGGVEGYVHANRVVAEGETELLFRIPPTGMFPYYQDMQLGPDGARLATFGVDELVVWDAISGEQLYRLGGGLQFGVMAWSPDGSHFVTGGQTGEINVWDAQSGTPQLSLQAHRDPLTSISWSPTGDRILSASTDGTAKIWNVGEAPLTLPGPDTVLCAAWSPAGEHMAVAFFDGTINIYQADTGEVINNIRENTLFHAGFLEKTCQLSWSADGRRFVIVSKDPIPRVWDVTTGERAFFLLGHSDIVADVAWSPQGGRIATSSLDGTVRIWDANTGAELLAIPTGGIQGVSNLDWSPDGVRVMLSSFSEDVSSIKVWDADSGELRLEYFPDTYRVLAAAWSPDGERIAAFCDDDAIRVWPASFNELLMTIPGAKFLVGQPAWFPSGERLLAGSADGLVRMWEVATGEELLNLDFGEKVEVLLSPDGKHMAVIQFSEGTVSVFPMWATLEELQGLASECCVVRELTPDERALFGLPER